MVESKIKYIRIINIEKKGPCFKKASVNTKPAIYPHGIDPESPKNIFADGLLCLKKERKAAKITKPRNWKSLSKKFINETIFIVRAKKIICNAVRPSIPSMKLNKLINQSQEKIISEATK